MNPHLKIFALIVLLSVSALSPRGAMAACPAVPANDIWGHVSNDAIASYVVAAHGGNWSAYIEKWEGRLDDASEMVAKNSILVFHKSGTWLRGDDLAAYAEDIRARLSATRCLADTFRDGETPGAAFAGTAAGGGGS